MKKYINILKLFLLAVILFFFGNCYSASEELSTEIINLSESEWSIDFEDKAEYASLEYSHQSWATIEIPGNQRNVDSSHRGVLMRKSFELDAENFTSALALTLGRVYDRDEVYLNGKIIGINGKARRHSSK